MKKIVFLIILFTTILASLVFAIDTPPDGSVMLVQQTPHIINGKQFQIGVDVSTLTQLVVSYEFTVTYDPIIIELDKTIGIDGVEPGSDGFVTEVNATTAGELIIGGFDYTGRGPGNSLQFLALHWKALAPGTTDINLTIDELVDETATVIRNPLSYGLSIDIDEYETGDVNHDMDIDIVDALLTAQYYVELNPSEFYTENADVDYSGAIDIVDALLISQYYVGFITVFPCDSPQPWKYRIHVSANVLTTIHYSGDYSSSGSEFLPLDIGPYPEPFTATIVGVGYELRSMMLMGVYVDGQKVANGWPSDTAATVSTTPDAPVRHVEFFYANSNPSPPPDE